MIIWLASYPKSGNTFLRSIIASLVYSEDGNFEMDKLASIRQFPRTVHFEGLTNDTGNIHEIKKYWVAAQEKINLNNKVIFFKTHNANIKIDNYPFTNKKNTLATIYVVRDPRNVVSSIAHHYSLSMNESKKFILTQKSLRDTLEGEEKGILTPLGTWSDHYNSWTLHNNNLLIIKYEDLINKPKEELDKIIIFLKPFINFSVNENKINKIIETTKFDSLKKMEKEGKYDEYAHGRKNFNFFNKGPENKWQDNLEVDIKDEIEKKFYNLMKKLGYL